MQSSTSSGTSSIEANEPNYNGLLNGSAKRIYSSMRITKKEMPYLRAQANSKNVSSNSILSSIESGDKHKFVTSINKKQTLNTDAKPLTTRPKPTSNCISNKSLTTTNTTSKNTRFIPDKPKHNSSNKTIKQSYSKEFPNGLPFEDEFYHQKRDKSISSKSELSDYGSIENDSDHSHSLLPFEEEFACRRPSVEALYVDFSKPIAKKAIANSYSKSSNNEFSSSSCSSNSSSNVAINKAHNYDYSSKNYVYNPNEVIVSNQPVVYVAVQWRSNQKGLTDRKPHRFDAV